jgi:aminopeptidase N
MFENRMKQTIIFVLVVSFISACSVFGVHFKLHNPKRAGTYPEPTVALTRFGDQDSKYRSTFDVTYYKLNVRFGKNLDKEKGISGTAEMRGIALAELDTIQLDAAENLNITSVIGANFPSVAMTGISCNTTPVALKFVRSGRALFVVFPSRVKVNDIISVIITYNGIPPEADKAPWKGGFVRKKDDAGNHWWGVACESEGASTWWPCKDVVNDEPSSCDLEFEVPHGYTAVSNGSFVNEKVTSDSSAKQFSWHVSYPINLYNITFYIGKFRELKDSYNSSVTGKTLPLNHFVLNEHYETAKVHFKQLKDHLAVYEKYFGAYPFYDDGFKLVESPYAGMEHQTAIAYGNKFKNNQLGFDYIILHETAHEWWGNSLTAYDLADGWLHEGFATYAEAIYVEEKFGRQQYNDYMKIYRWTIINRRPLVGPYGIRYFNYKDGDIYTKGAWVLHTLRETIADDSVFFDIIKTFATRFTLKNVRSQDFINIVNEKTKSDYSWFFAQYLHNRFVPELEYYQDGNVFYYSWNPDYLYGNAPGYFPLPVRVKLNTNDTDTLYPRSVIDTVRCEAGFESQFVSNVLVKFTENKKLKKQFRKQVPTIANY